MENYFKAFNFYDYSSLLLSFIAFGSFAHMAIKRSRGYSFGAFQTLAILGLIVSTFIFRLLFQPGSWVDNLFLTFRDVGVGLITSGIYALFRRGNVGMYFLPGFICLALYGGYFIVTKIFTGNNGSSEAITKLADNQSQILVQLGVDDTIEEIQSELDKYNSTYQKAFPDIDLSEDQDLAQYYVVNVPKEHVNELLKLLNADDENVDTAEPNAKVSFIPNIPGNGNINYRKPNPPMLANDPHINEQWGLESTELNSLFGILSNLKPKKKAKVAIVDTGVDSGHEDIKDVFLSSPGDSDVQGHGTHCAGIAAAATNNNIGISSANWDGKFIQIMGFKGLSDNGSGTDYSVAKAIIDAADAGADVISLSLGAPHPTPPAVEVDAIEYAQSKGAIVVAAAGNSDDDAQYYSPANIKNVIVVGAVNERNNKAIFSNTTQNVGLPIAAPGVDILSLKNGGGYIKLSGTSMATPYVAGILGLLRSIKPDISQAEAFELLQQTGIEIQDQAKIGKLINPKDAVNKLLSRKKSLSYN